MEVVDILNLLGGLALFLYGMRMMSDGLEDAAGNRMKQILEKLTANRFLGVAVGAGITAVIQSSSATTVMVVGFVNSGMMTLSQAVWIIMGANIGTTITGQLIALDVGMMAPLIAFIGVAMIVFLKAPKTHCVGKILAGLGIIFIGMDMMSSATLPLQNSEAFVSLMTKFSNPLLGILAGAVFTAVIQSSSASVGILQTLAVSGLISFPNAVYVLFGQNIGTCVTALLASVGANRSAKRTTIIHLIFNIVGTIIFTTLCLTLPFADWIGGLTPGEPAKQIANMHTVFNIGATLLLLPFGNFMAKLAEKIFPDRVRNVQETPSIAALNEEYRRNRTYLGASAIHMDLLQKEISEIVSLAAKNVDDCFRCILERDSSMLPGINETEETIDCMNNEIAQYISKILVHNNSGNSVSNIEEYFLITGNAERISDHAMNIGGYVKVMERKNIQFSEQANAEIQKMRTTVRTVLQKTMNREEDIAGWLFDIETTEEKIDDMTAMFRENHLERMRSGVCSEESCVLFSELLTDFERIGDHTLNIAQAYAAIYARK